MPKCQVCCPLTVAKRLKDVIPLGEDSFALTRKRAGKLCLPALSQEVKVLYLLYQE